MSADLNNTLRHRMQRAVDDGRAAPLELALTDWALRHAASGPVALAFAACARAVADGHSCLALHAADIAVPGEAPFCNRADLDSALAHSELVGTPGESRPMIVDGEQLYLQRYWNYENLVAQRLQAMLAAPPEPVDTGALLPGGGLFDYDWVGANDTNWQAVAACVAARQRFAVISGGPGTGKTYTVLRLMRLLIETALNAGKAVPHICLAAPTGKAAARMLQSARKQLAAMDLPEAVRAHIPLDAKTLHRLIGIGRNTTQPRYDHKQPLAADVVIVDEASMIDLPMMAKLLDALHDDARLILLGDRYQLASVESGSVLTELCNAAGINAFTSEQQTLIAPLLRQKMPEGTGPLANHVVTLQTSHRFNANSPIGRLAAAVNCGDIEAALAAVGGESQDTQLITHADKTNFESLIQSATDHYQRLAEAKTPEDALLRLRDQCVLCAVRNGPAGSNTLNLRINNELARRQSRNPNERWHHGRPIIVTRNNYRAGLFNGDTGVCIQDNDGRLRVWFETDAGVKAFLPSALPEHDTVYAMTVHKSQGSEFEHVSLVLPTQDNRVLTRELLYTGITRAKKQVRIFSPEAIFCAAITRPVVRYSGLSGRIY